MRSLRRFQEGDSVRELVREIAGGCSARPLLQKHCQPGGKPFAVAVKAFLALTAEQPYDGSDINDQMQALCSRTLGRGHASADRLKHPSGHSAVFIWQGVIDSSADKILVQLPVPKAWLDAAQAPKLRLMLASDVPTNEAVRELWASRKTSIKLRPGPDEKAIRPSSAVKAHPSYPLVERLYSLDRLPQGVVVTGDIWLVELEYEELADYYAGIEFTPQQRVAFAAELFDEGETPTPPQSMVQGLPIAATMNQLSLKATPVRSPLVLKSRVQS